MKIAAIYKRLGFDAPSPLLKQAPMTVLFLAAAISANYVTGLYISSQNEVIIGVVAVIAATAFAAIISPRESLWKWGLVIPAIDFIAIGLLCDGMGATSTVFASLVALPTVWFAAEEGRRFVLFAAIGIAVTVYMPFFLGMTIDENIDAVIRGGFKVLAYGVAAAIINEISHTARHRLDNVRRLVEQGRVMLEAD
jgi:sigma-B regulation protein RsbU (phosphoserine phosphatase)